MQNDIVNYTTGKFQENPKQRKKKIEEENNLRSRRYRNNPKNKEKVSQRQKDWISNPENHARKDEKKRINHHDEVKGAVIKDKRNQYLAKEDVKIREKVRASTYNRKYTIENKEKIQKIYEKNSTRN